MLENVLKYIISLRGFEVSIKEASNGTIHTFKCAQSNYFRTPLVDENITGSGRQYVIAQSDISFKPRRGDSFRVSSTEYYGIERVEEMIGFGNLIGYRVTVG